MARNLKIRDLTLRDGQQSSFATRMSQAQVDRCLPFYKDANFYAMEVWGGAVPDSVMRYLNENPWTRLETIYKAVGKVSKLTALSRGRNLFGYAPYPDDVIDGFCRNAIESGLGIMRIFDALNDVDNVNSTIKYVKQYGGIADCAVCYTVDPKYPEPSFMQRLMGKKQPQPVFTDAYFLDKAKQMAALGADMITIKDMSGLIPPRRVATLVKLFKKNISIPVDFHTHCTPGYGLASVLAAIVAGVDIVDTNCWYFAEGTGAPAIELIHVFCGKLGVDTGVNMEAVAKINTQLREIRKELNQSVFGADKPEPKAFNPLTDKLPAEIDGGVGLGKTHLMHAIGHYSHQLYPQMNIVYITSEDFTNQLVSAMQQNRNQEFRDRFRNADILMVDDIQFIAGKQSTQEEFFHTFNHLREAGKQIIMTSDKPPKEIQKLEERLCSRFEGGLIADIQRPDFETRLAILRRKAEFEHIIVSDEILELIAEKIDTNVRELEGSLTRLTAYSTLARRPIDMQLAREALRELFNHSESRRITCDIIQDAVASYYGVSVDDIKSARRSHDVTVPRQIAMYLSREMLGLSLTKIGDAFGGRHYTTVMSSIEKVEDSIKQSPSLASLLDDIRRIIKDTK